MDIEFPPAYAPSVDVLERKLKAAIDYAQRIRIIDTLPVNPSCLPLWKVRRSGCLASETGSTMSQSDPSNPSIDRVMFRLSNEEAAKLMGNGQSNGTKVSSAQSAFWSLRQSMTHIAKGVTDGNLCWVLSDEEQTAVICLRVGFFGYVSHSCTTYSIS
jgi:hypothetical protein